MTKRICYAPFQNLEIYDDDAYACCCNWCNFFSFGKISTSNVEQIWNSENAQKLRTHILNDDYSICNQEVCPFIYRKNFELKIDNETVCEPVMKKYPATIKLAYDYDCNIACSFCRETVRRNTQEETASYDERFFKIIPLLKDAKRVAMNGVGEPFASTHSKKIIKAIADTYPNIGFDFLTNGTLCTEELFKELNIIDKIEIIRLTLNAACTETYNKVVPGFGFWFEKIIKNIEFLCELKKKRDFNFHIQMVVTADNFRDIPDFIHLAKKYDAFASMWQIYPEVTNISNKNRIKEMNVFKEDHPDYNEMVSLLQNDPSLNEPHVILTPLLLAIKNKEKLEIK